jgi:hypothetical protein
MSVQKTEPIDFEEELRRMFDENFQRLRAESGHSLSPDVREAAWQQVLMYWRRLRDVAETITDTEVHLNLPNQKSPKGRRFCIEGVVDIVREIQRVTMYDIKTHDLEFVQANKEFYQKQLNIYAHIWQELRGQQLDEVAVISTRLPEAVKRALLSGNSAALSNACEGWDPVVTIPFDAQDVAETIREFGDAVDAIEDGQYSPPPVALLRQRETRDETFAQRTCQNCDARFSCSSYREVASAPRRRGSAALIPFFDTLIAEADQEGWRDAVVEASVNAAPSAREL